jgi:hypothetical protein
MPNSVASRLLTEQPRVFSCRSEWNELSVFKTGGVVKPKVPELVGGLGHMRLDGMWVPIAFEGGKAVVWLRARPIM